MKYENIKIPLSSISSFLHYFKKICDSYTNKNNKLQDI